VPLLAAIVLAVGVSACGGGGDDGGSGSGTEQEFSGEVKIDGSSTVGPLSKAAAEGYADDQPKVNVTVGISGTGGGFKKFCNNETDISDASRPIKDAEKKECEAKGIQYVEMIVANDALTVVVNKDNTWADCLTVPQLKAVWDAGSKVNNWNQIDPKFPNATSATPTSRRTPASSRRSRSTVVAAASSRTRRTHRPVPTSRCRARCSST
jgi:phosphate transport system substrate-binding protein